MLTLWVLGLHFENLQTSHSFSPRVSLSGVQRPTTATECVLFCFPLFSEYQAQYQVGEGVMVQAACPMETTSFNPHNWALLVPQW